MNNHNLKHIADGLFERFIIEYPESKNGIYLARQTNQVLAFDRYFNHLTSEEIRCLAGCYLNNREIKSLQKMINLGIEKYLNDNIKTLALY